MTGESECELAGVQLINKVCHRCTMVSVPFTVLNLTLNLK